MRLINAFSLHRGCRRELFRLEGVWCEGRLLANAQRNCAPCHSPQIFGSVNCQALAMLSCSGPAFQVARAAFSRIPRSCARGDLHVLGLIRLPLATWIDCGVLLKLRKSRSTRSRHRLLLGGSILFQKGVLRVVVHRVPTNCDVGRLLCGAMFPSRAACSFYSLAAERFENHGKWERKGDQSILQLGARCWRIVLGTTRSALRSCIGLNLRAKVFSCQGRSHRSEWTISCSCLWLFLCGKPTPLRLHIGHMGNTLLQRHLFHVSSICGEY